MSCNTTSFSPSAQLLSYATPQRAVAEEDDMEAAEFDEEHFDR